MNDILFALWFFLPVGLANASPIFANKIPLVNRWHTPLDFGKAWHGKRIFGEHKTWRGLTAAIIVSTLAIALQKFMYTRFGWVQSLANGVNYEAAIIWWLGPLLGFGALAGDAIESFFKRQVNVSPGESWFPFDQTDYILGGVFASLLVVRLSGIQYLAIVAVWLGIHIVASYFGYLFKLKDRPI